MTTVKTILILNGPNLNMLGQRETQVYGNQTLSEIECLCNETARALGYRTEFRQSNSESDLIRWVHEGTNSEGIIINPAAYTHTSIAIRDALSVCTCPIVEVHLSNIYSRESFRHKSLISGVVHGMVCGFGANGYKIALYAVSELLENK